MAMTLLSHRAREFLHFTTLQLEDKLLPRSEHMCARQDENY
jgi:hypothetical protein